MHVVFALTYQFDLTHVNQELLCILLVEAIAHPAVLTIVELPEVAEEVLISHCDTLHVVCQLLDLARLLC